MSKKRHRQTPELILPKPPESNRSFKRNGHLRVFTICILGAVLAGAAWTARSSYGLRERILRDKDLPTLQEIVQRNPNDAAAQSCLGRRAFIARQYEVSLSAYGAAVRLDPDRAETHFGYALALYRMGRVQSSKAEFEQALKLDDRLAGAEMMLGGINLSHGDISGGLARLRRATSLGPRDDKAFWLLARCYLQMDKQQEAVEALRNAIRLKDSSAPYHTALGEALTSLDRVDEARSHFERALQIDPNYGQACAQLGGLYLNHIPGIESLDKAEHLLKQATQLQTLDAQQVYFDLGQVYSEQGRSKEAADAYRNAIKNGGDNEAVFYALANACRRAGELRDAEVAEKRFRYKSEMRLQIPLMEQQLKAGRIDPQTHLLLAQAYRDIKQSDQAIKHYALYMRLNPEDRATAQSATEYVRNLNLAASRLLPESETPEPL